jgi:hypothetical protein
MTQRDKVRKYLADNKGKMNLRQWNIKVADDLPPDDSWADVEVSQNLWTATIRLSNDFFKESAEHQREILAHELSHVHYASVERLVETLEKILGDQAYKILESLWDIESERAADSIAVPLGRLLPLPNFKERKR